LPRNPAVQWSRSHSIPEEYRSNAALTHEAMPISQPEATSVSPACANAEHAASSPEWGMCSGDGLRSATGWSSFARAASDAYSPEIELRVNRRMASLNGPSIWATSLGSPLVVTAPESTWRSACLAVQCRRRAGCKQECMPDMDTTTAEMAMRLTPSLFSRLDLTTESQPRQPGFVHRERSAMVARASFEKTDLVYTRRAYRSPSSHSESWEGTLCTVGIVAEIPSFWRSAAKRACAEVHTAACSESS
jgi:hypothetical protein